MEKYIGVKLINAELCLNTFNDEGYRITHEDGSISWHTKEEFEKSYKKTDGLKFGLAIEAVKLGEKIARQGWNGKGMFVYYVPENKYPFSTEVGKSIADLEGKVEYGAYIAMKTAQGNVVPWLASQTDVLAEDWLIVE